MKKDSPELAKQRLELAREAYDGGKLDAAGNLLGIHRITKDAGHAFDEADESFGKRLNAVFVGHDVAGATVASAMVEFVKPKHKVPEKAK